VSYPRPRCKLPRRPTELRAQFHLLVFQRFDPRDYMMDHSKNPRACYTFHILSVFDIRGDSQERVLRV
jgi:hypothetical protein